MKKNEKAYIIDEKGSLGLLALGYKGLEAWRKKVKESKKVKDGKKEK